MREFPYSAVVIVEDLVLSIILHHVFSDQLVIYDGWPHRLLVFFNLLLVFEALLNVRLDLSVHHFRSSAGF